MKRGGPLRRRTSLPRSSTLFRSTPIPATSEKRRRENRTRTETLRPLREAQSWCSRCGVTGVGLDAHEIRSRARGGSITDPANIRLLCRLCHSFITEHPRVAESEGWAA